MQKLKLYFNFENILLLLIVTLCFDNIPLKFQVNFFSGGFSNKLSWYIFIVLCIYFYKYKIYQSVFLREDNKIFLKYVSVLVVFTFFSTILGIIKFPYFEELVATQNGLEGQKFNAVKSFLLYINLQLNDQEILSWWIVLRSIKGIILDCLYTYGFSYILYSCIKDRWQEYIPIVEKGVKISLYIMIAYSIIEILYLAGNETAKELLVIINPYLHTIGVEHNWWPPLLWEGQLRSILSEPSRVGNFSAFVIPILWSSYIYKKNSRFEVTILIILFSFMIFLTQARTAVAMLIGMLFLLGVLLVWSRSYSNLKQYVIIIFITLLSFCASILFIGYSTGAYRDNIELGSQTYSNSEYKETTQAVADYVDNNVTSLAGDNKRSNRARYALIKTHLKLWSENPILGVGDILNSAYVVKLFDEDDLRSDEVKMWITNYNEEGILKYSFNAMNEYVTRLATQGLVGLFIYIFPFIYAINKLLKMLRNRNIKDEVMLIGATLAFISTWISGLNGSLTILYTYWITLSFVYAMIRDKEKI